MFAEILRPEQSLLFGGDGGKNYRAAGMIFGDAEGARQFEQDAAAGGVVGSAMENIVACISGRMPK